MKKLVLPLLMFCLTGATLQAQESPTGSNDYNKWSIDLGGGLNKAATPFNDGYSMNTVLNLFHTELGFRYMFNTKFGLKLQGGYDVLTEGDDSRNEFETNMYSVNLQGYANLGRMMDFETWTQRINVLGHMGVGIAGFSNDNFEGTDRLGSFLMGMTLQYRIANRVALFGDITMTNNFSQNKTWNGGQLDEPRPGFDSTLYTGTLGLNIYLGKYEKHADWFVDEKSDELEELEDRLAELETMMNDTDKDGVPDYLDAEPNTITGVAVDSKGRTIDKNNNGIPDELESYIETQNAMVVQQASQNANTNLKDLINSGYINVYFDFNKDQPNAQSVSGINFLIKYLKENPTTNADVVGYADEIGNSDYNKDLSQRRAENVKKILVDAGIEGSRLNIIGNGEDTSVNKDSRYARQVVRRVTFMLK